jgi:ADP-ribosyl-[dinitrogen reductase] hydrolase
MNKKIRGALLGVVVGDILGEPYENQKTTVSQTPPSVSEFKQYPMYTDDTEMTLITLAHIIHFKEIRPASLAIEYAANASSFRKYGGNAKRTQKVICQRPELWESAGLETLKEGSWGNGCLMRLMPIALWSSKHDLFDNITKILVSTHNNPEALSCSMTFCLLIKLLINNAVEPSGVQTRYLPTAEDFLITVINLSQNDRLLCKLNMIRQKLIISDVQLSLPDLRLWIQNNVTEIGIRAVDTFAIIIAVMVYHLKHKTQEWKPHEVLSFIISLGGDTDTNASICGGLLGALYGDDWLPAKWVNAIPDYRRIEDAIRQFTSVCLSD